MAQSTFIQASNLVVSSNYQPNNEIAEATGFDIIPDGYDKNVYYFVRYASMWVHLYAEQNGYEWAMFNWDTDLTSKKLVIEDDRLTIKVKDGSGFKTSIGDMAFQAGGKYYFQIKLNQGNLVKIGVSRKDIVPDQAFSDTSGGWAIYNGELRHNSNSSGPKYGSSIQAGDIIGVMLDMEVGTLSFSKNGRSWGVAYKDDELRKGELFAAVAPIYCGDSYTISRPTPED